jgi:hypothetical protein
VTEPTEIPPSPDTGADGSTVVVTTSIGGTEVTVGEGTVVALVTDGLEAVTVSCAAGAWEGGGVKAAPEDGAVLEPADESAGLELGGLEEPDEVDELVAAPVVESIGAAPPAETLEADVSVTAGGVVVDAGVESPGDVEGVSAGVESSLTVAERSDRDGY